MPSTSGDTGAGHVTDDPTQHTVACVRFISISLQSVLRLASVPDPLSHPDVTDPRRERGSGTVPPLTPPIMTWGNSMADELYKDRSFAPVSQVLQLSD